MNRPVPHRKNGNKECEILVGKSLFALVLYLKAAFPDALADEAATFIYNQTGSVYSRHQISCKMKGLGMTNKRVSTEAYQAFEPNNLLKFHQFWTLGGPLGVVGVRRCRLLDVDEFGIALQKTNRNSGHAHSSIRIRKPGHYCRNTKLTCLFAIEPGDPTLPAHIDGSIETPRKWIRIFRRGGTDEFMFAAFCDHICRSFETYPAPGDVDAERVFLWDNLSAHKTALVYQTVEGRGGLNRFRIVCRPPYQPKVAPVEYKICDVCHELQRQINATSNTDDMEQMIYAIVGTVGDNGNFNNTFDHCGYTIDGVYPPGGYAP